MSDIARPPYRADHVGSLVRPAPLLTARRRFDARSIEREELAEVEAEAIRDALRMQRNAGLLAATDGGFRSRGALDFIEGLDGVEMVAPPTGDTPDNSAPRLSITDRLDFPDDHPMLAGFRFLASATPMMPKLVLPSPSLLGFGIAPADIHVRDYRDDEVLRADIARIYAKAVTAFHAAGCRYLQIDDTLIASLGDDAAGRRVERWAGLIRDAVAERPDDMTVALWLGRDDGDAVTFGSDAGSEAAADAIFNLAGADLYFVAFDGGSVDGLQALRHLPAGGPRVVAGLVSATSATLEKLDDLRRQLDAAGQLIDVGQLGIAPRSGFASASIGEDDQKRKLDLLVRVAEKVWGGVDA